MLTEKQIELQRTIIAYLCYKLNVAPEWYTEKQEFLFGRTPEEVVNEGEGKHLIEWLESRLGLRPGQGF